MLLYRQMALGILWPEYTVEIVLKFSYRRFFPRFLKLPRNNCMQKFSAHYSLDFLGIYFHGRNRFQFLKETDVAT